MEMSLVWLDMSKTSEKLIAMVNVRCMGTGLVEAPGYSVCKEEKGGNGGRLGLKS